MPNGIFDGLPEPSFVLGNCKVFGDGDILIYHNRPRRFGLVRLYCGHGRDDYDQAVFPVNPSAYFYHRSLHDKVGMFVLDQHQEMDTDFLLRAVRVAKIRYYDEHWGNQRLVEGTKTLRALQNGSLPEIVRRTIKENFGRLPWYLRLAIIAQWRSMLLVHATRVFWGGIKRSLSFK